MEDKRHEKEAAAHAKEHDAEEAAAATKLQSLQRGRKAKKDVERRRDMKRRAEMDAEELEALRDASARRIQRMARGKLGRNAFDRKVAEIEAAKRAKHNGATGFQKLYRG